MSRMYTEKPNLKTAFAALRSDLVGHDGPRISTMRNYRFAIVQYNPEEEFKLRAHTRELSNDLTAHGWVVMPISLQQLLLNRVRAQGPEWTDALIRLEQRLSERAPERALNHLKDKIIPLVEGANGLAADCVRQLNQHLSQHPDQHHRTLVLIGRAGALYPFFRSSALLKHLDGRTQNVPVVLLYPGERKGATGLSFMGMLAPDNDYRPRIYP